MNLFFCWWVFRMFPVWGFYKTACQHASWFPVKTPRNNIYTCSTLRSMARDFPGVPVVKTPRFQCRGHRFDPCLGNWDPTCHVAWPKKKKRSMAKLFSLINVTTYTLNSRWELPLFYIFIGTWYWQILKDLIIFCEIVSNCGLICISLITNVVEHLFIFLGCASHFVCLFLI